MYPILIGGYRPQYDEKALKEFLTNSRKIAPRALGVALDLLDGLTIDKMVEEYGKGRGYTLTLRARGKFVLKLVLEANPERFGLEKIEPVTQRLTTSQLAQYCGVGNHVILSMVRRRERLGLPAPGRYSR